jgi:hypothetical protein
MIRAPPVSMTPLTVLVMVPTAAVVVGMFVVLWVRPGDAFSARTDSSVPDAARVRASHRVAMAVVDNDVDFFRASHARVTLARSGFKSR